MYLDIGCEHWLRSEQGKYDRVGVELVRGHYSRRKPESPQFMPPGETFVLITRDRLSCWGWWRPHPSSGIRAMNGRDGWTCSVFARHGGPVASALVLDAERALVSLEQSGATAGPCGPDGMLTYVDPKKILSENPGYCFKCAGWKQIGWCAKKQKPLLQKALALDEPTHIR